LGYNIIYKKSVQRDLKKFDKAEVRRLLNKIENELPEKANSYPALKGQFAGLRKFRIGDYRVIFVIIDNDVIILRIGHRKDVYKKKI
jgi:mRNA interferase RelE/StbE